MPSKQIKGEPFKLTSAVPVDLFPHTNHCELVMLFERGERKVKALDTEEKSNKEDGTFVNEEKAEVEEGKSEECGGCEKMDREDSGNVSREEPQDQTGDVKEETTEGKDKIQEDRSAEPMDSEPQQEGESVQKGDEQQA